MSDIPASHRTIGKYLRNRFGDPASVHRYVQDGDRRSIDILSAKDGLWDGLTCWGTIGLSDFEMVFGDTSVRVELLGVSPTESQAFGNVMSSLVFETLDHGPACRPGTLYANVLPQYELSDTMRQILLVSPFPWEELEPLVCDDRTVHWLMAIPVSASEAAYVQDQGYEALETLFESNNTDVFDLRRASVI